MIPFGAGDPAADLSPVLANPMTGEVVQLDDLAPDPLIELHGEVMDFIERARQARRQIEEELERRRRAQGGSAKQYRGDSLSMTKTTTRKWNEAATVSVLQRLVEDGHVPVEEADALVPEKTVRKPDGRGLNSLVTRLTAAGELEAASLLLEARSEYAKWEASGPALTASSARNQETEETR